jgi:hypothetical protein
MQSMETAAFSPITCAKKNLSQRARSIRLYFVWAENDIQYAFPSLVKFLNIPNNLTVSVDPFCLEDMSAQLDQGCLNAPGDIK